jgi:hypothetical protein
LTVNSALRNWTVTLIATMAASIMCASAQHLAQEGFGGRWPDEPPARTQVPPATAQQTIPPAAERSTPTQTPAAEPSKTPPPPARRPAPAPDITGTWSGTVTQVGSQSKYTVVLTITAKGAETDYPELGCGGKLRRIGASPSYVFFCRSDHSRSGRQRWPLSGRHHHGGARG